MEHGLKQNCAKFDKFYLTRCCFFYLLLYQRILSMNFTHNFYAKDFATERTVAINF